MSGSKPVWRAILWVERFLPEPWTLETPRSPSRARFAVLPIIGVTLAVPPLLRHGGAWAALWPAWHAQIEGAVLLLAVATLAAAVVAAVVTWSRERKNHA